MINLTTTPMSVLEPILDFDTEEQRWEAVRQRDQRADGAFFYGVTSTGVYCRPSCASRQPLRENVRFFNSWEAAEQAGFRACKRCSPKANRLAADHADEIIRACQAIEAADNPPSLGELARAANLSLYHFLRLFKKVVGVTPKQYAMEKRLKRVEKELQPGATVTSAMADSGFTSSSRFYQETAGRLGMKPSAYKGGAAGVQIRYALAKVYLGWVLVASTDQGICAIQFGDTPENLVQVLYERFPKAELHEHDAGFRKSLQKVIAFLESPRRQQLDLPLDIRGTAFQRRVWQALREIPAGTTQTYSAVAARIGSPKAARAVAQACAANKIAVAIPCHRVVRGDGGLGGYRWGLERKRALLEREKS